MSSRVYNMVASLACEVSWTTVAGLLMAVILFCIAYPATKSFRGMGPGGRIALAGCVSILCAIAVFKLPTRRTEDETSASVDALDGLINGLALPYAATGIAIVLLICFAGVAKVVNCLKVHIRRHRRCPGQHESHSNADLSDKGLPQRSRRRNRRETRS